MKFATLLNISFKSALNRKWTLSLLVFSITISTILLLGVEKISEQAENSFMQSVSGIDLIVGARGSSTQLILYSIFHLGNATNNIGIKSVNYINNNENVNWTIPISLGDNHKNFPVVATNNNMFEYYKYNYDTLLRFREGRTFQNDFQVVLGYEIANKLNYKLGQTIHISHSKVLEHAENFTISGILEPTGTPIDKSIFITLKAMDIIHAGFMGNVKQSKQITALLVSLKQKKKIFSLQREINTYTNEPLTAILPGVALGELWNMLSAVERTLYFVSVLVMLSSLLGLASTILSGLNERKNEISILRMVGASPKDICFLLLFEGLMVVSIGVIFGIILLYLLLFSLKNYIILQYGIMLSFAFSLSEAFILLKIFTMSVLITLIPAIKSYIYEIKAK